MNAAQRQMLIGLAAAIVLTVLFFLLLLNPKMNDISETRGQIATAEDEERSLRNELERLRELSEETVRTKARLAKASKYLPPTPDLPGFIRLVQRAASDAGVTLSSIAPGPPEELERSTGIQTIRVTLTISGGFRRIEDFLTRLEGLDRVVEITSISLGPGEDQLTDQVVLDSTVSMRMYVVEENATFGGSVLERPTPSPSPSPTGEAS